MRRRLRLAYYHVLLFFGWRPMLAWPVKRHLRAVEALREAFLAQEGALEELAAAIKAYDPPRPLPPA